MSVKRIARMVSFAVTVLGLAGLALAAAACGGDETSSSASGSTARLLAGVSVEMHYDPG